MIGYTRRSVTTSNGAVRFIPSRARTASRGRQIGPHRFIHIDAGRPIAVDELQQSLAAIQHRPIEVLRALGEYRSLPCRYIYIIEVVGHWLISLRLWGQIRYLLRKLVEYDHLCSNAYPRRGFAAAQRLSKKAGRRTACLDDGI